LRSDGGKTAVLELKNLTTLELVRLPFSYAGAFAESAPSDKRLYTLGQRPVCHSYWTPGEWNGPTGPTTLKLMDPGVQQS